MRKKAIHEPHERHEKKSDKTLDVVVHSSDVQISLFDRVATILDQMRGNVVRAVNTSMVQAYWLIGREIVEEVQFGKDRAGYGCLYQDRFSIPSDNPTIGLILCADKNEAVAKYSVLAEWQRTFASKYLQYLPTEAELKYEIERQKTLFLLQQKDKEHTFTPKHQDNEPSAEAKNKPPDKCQAFTNQQQGKK